MKIHRLDIEGFGPFRDEQTIDFDAFAHDGIFLIGGKTGAGKSSILDAISFALYGGVPRYDDGEKRFRSDHCALDEPTRVRLEFTAAGRRLRVERVPAYERLKKSGSGTTPSPAAARLEEFVDGGWVGIAARSVDVADELKPILGLTQAQFLQVILLAQGRFARFLHARNDERQALLQTLFDSRRFEDYECELEHRRKAAVDRLALETGTLRVQLENAENLAEQLLMGEAEGVDDRLERVRQASMRAAHAAEVASADEQAAQRAHTAADAVQATLVRQRDTQRRRDRARVALRSLEARAVAVADDRDLLERARAAEVLRASLDSRDRAVTIEQSAQQNLDRASAAWGERGGALAGPHDLELLADTLVAERGTWDHARAAEAETPRLAAARALSFEQIAAIDAEAAEIGAARTRLPLRVDELTALAAAAWVRADAKAAAELRVVEERERRDAAKDAQALEAAAAAAEDRARRVGKALTRASAALDDLRDRRFRDHAGELAELLIDGEPCAVCGAREHPTPAARLGAAVTDDLIESAERDKRDALAADADAAAALDAARREAADASARAAGRTVDEAQLALDEAVVAVEAADAAANQRRVHLQERDELVAELDTLGSRASALAVDRTAAVVDLSRLDEKIAKGEEAVAAARGDFDSVGARIADAEATVAAARGLVAALHDADDAAGARRQCDEDLAAGLAGSPFADAVATRASLRAPAERERLEKTVQTHDAEVASQKQTLMELELEAVPEDPIDMTDAEVALAAAAEAWRAAVARHAEVVRRATQLSEACAAAVIAHESIADLARDVAVVERLANTVAGRAPNTRKMNLETFVLAAELEEIVAAANRRLEEMSAGRYLLQHTDALAHRGAASGLGIDVMDRHTGQARPVQSLSGGETFLASLALALGLAEVVTARAGGIRLDTLFIDEGFGSLDGDTLDVAMRTLDELRQGGRVVGIISHVEAMKNEIPARLDVEVTPQGPSVIRQPVAALV